MRHAPFALSLLLELTNSPLPQFYIKQRTDHASDFPLDPSSPGDETGLNGSAGPSDLDSQRWTWWGGFDDTPVESATATASGVFGSLPTQVTDALGNVLDASDPQATPTGLGMPSLQGDGLSVEEMGRMNEAANEWFAFALVTVGVSGSSRLAMPCAHSVQFADARHRRRLAVLSAHWKLSCLLARSPVRHETVSEATFSTLTSRHPAATPARCDEGKDLAPTPRTWSLFLDPFTLLFPVLARLLDVPRALPSRRAVPLLASSLYDEIDEEEEVVAKALKRARPGSA